MPKLNAPCYICKNKQIGCHDKCEIYKMYTEELERMRDNKRIVKGLWTSDLAVSRGEYLRRCKYRASGY